MDLRVRRASADDVPTIAALRRASTLVGSRRAEQAGPTSDDDCDDDFEVELAEWFAHEQHQRITWLAEVGDRPVGMLNLMVFTRMPKPRSAAAAGSARRWGYVANVYVVPEHRNRGIGGAMLDEAVALADAQGFARLVLSPSERSVPFYERAGFASATSLMVRVAGQGR